MRVTPSLTERNRDGLHRHQYREAPWGRPGPGAAVRHLPVQHGAAEHRRLHRLGPDHRPVHPDRLDHPDRRQDLRLRAGPGARSVRLRFRVSTRRLGRRRWRHRRPDDHLPAAGADRLHRWPDGVRRRQHPRRRGGCHRHHGRGHRGHRPDVPRRDDHGPAGRLHDAQARRAVGRQDQARVRDAGQQLLRRHLGHVPGDRWLPRRWPVRGGVLRPRRERRRLPRRQQPAAADLDLRGAGQDPVPQQRHQPRRLHAARHQRGCRAGQVDPVPDRGQPRPRPRAAAGVHVLREGHRQGLGAGRGRDPVPGRHPRDLLPVRADEAEADPRGDPRRNDRRRDQPDLRLRPASPGRTRLDHRGLAAVPGRQPRRRDAVGDPVRRRLLPGGQRAAQARPRRGRRRPRRRHRQHGGDEGQEVVGLVGARLRYGASRSSRSCSRATPGWVPPRWGRRSCARRSTAPATPR